MDRSFLLQTKFLIPQISSDLLPRPHLVERLERAISKRLTLISAPPGYGKTTLLAELATHTSHPSAWYQLDTADGDPTIFLGYLIACLRNIQEKLLPNQPPSLGSGAASLLGDSEAETPVPATGILTVLINELAEAITGDWLIILEDYHLVTNPDIHKLVQVLLENGPPGLHLVISARIDPPLGLARLRARGMLAEFRAPDLRFSQEEVATWLGRAIPDLAEESVRLLNEKTEGWAAALQIVLSSLSGKDADSARRLIAELSGTQRFIFQYLAEEVFQQHAIERQRFLMYTAVLEQMNAGVCDALLDTENAQLLLDDLEQDNLFVISLDEKREWYRYHHLFREFLLGKLRREALPKIARLEARAGAYYEEQEEVEAAFTHYVRAQDFTAAARVLTEFAGDYVEHGRVAVLQRYLGELPDEWVRRHPELLLHHGDVLWRLGQVGMAISRYEDAQLAFAEQGDNVGVCWALTQMSRLARSQGNYRRARELAAEALTRVADDAYASRAIALMALAKSEGFLTSMDRGRSLAEESVAAARQAGPKISSRTRANLLRSLGHICWWHGDPRATVRYCQEALESVTDERSPIAASIYITMATPYGYRRDLDMAQKYAELGLDIARQLQLSTLLPRAYSTLGSILTRQGEWEEAEKYLRQALELSSGLGLDSYAQIMATGYLAQNLCVQGYFEAARQLVEGVLWERATNPDTYEMVVCRSVLADVVLENDQLDEAQSIFESLVEIGRRRQFQLPLAMVFFGLAYVHLRKGHRAEAIEYASQSVSILEPLGTWQLYLDQGERARLVCQALVESGQATPFVNQVLQRFSGGPYPMLNEFEAAIRVQCLGPFCVTVGDEEITQARWVSAKARDLLAYFVTFREQRLPLERATEAIWPESGGQGRAFHSALYRLRNALRTEGDTAKFILAKGGEYWLDNPRFQIDVDAFDALLDAARAAEEKESIQLYTQGIALHQGEYLSNLLYYDWALPERQRLMTGYLSALQRLATLHLAAGNLEEAIVLINQALQVDVLNEESHREAMRYYADIGDKAGLVRQYQQLQQVYQDELKMMPSNQTLELYRHLIEEVGALRLGQRHEEKELSSHRVIKK
jgi:LuxR family maltose regulon positive regulatory protein